MIRLRLGYYERPTLRGEVATRLHYAREDGRSICGNFREGGRLGWRFVLDDDPDLDVCRACQDYLDRLTSMTDVEIEEDE